VAELTFLEHQVHLGHKVGETRRQIARRLDLPTTVIAKVEKTLAAKQQAREVAS